MAARSVGISSLGFTALNWLVFVVAKRSPIYFETYILLIFTWYLQIGALIVGVGLASLVSFRRHRFRWSEAATCVYVAAILGVFSQYFSLNQMSVASWTIP